MRIRRLLTAALTCASMLGAVQAAEAPDDVADAKAMLAAGDNASAIGTLDVYLQSNPKDLDAQFTRAVALARAKRNNEAITAFTELTKELPKLAEPYNNLAAVYAAEGDYVRAHTALQNALIREPNSLSARINLGDVYTALAAVEYQRALSLDGSSATARSRVADISALRENIEGGSAPATRVAEVARPRPQPGKPASAKTASAKPHAPVAASSSATSESNSQGLAAENSAVTAAPVEEPATPAIADARVATPAAVATATKAKAATPVPVSEPPTVASASTPVPQPSSVASSPIPARGPSAMPSPPPEPPPARVAPTPPTVTVPAGSAYIPPPPLARAPAPAPAAPLKTPPSAIDEKSLIAFLQLWSKTLSNGELSRYLDLYASNFQPPAGLDRAKWLDRTRQQLAVAKRSKLVINGVRWKAAETSVLVQFQLEVQTGNNTDHSTRVLQLIRAPDHNWRIFRET